MQNNVINRDDQKPWIRPWHLAKFDDLFLEFLLKKTYINTFDKTFINNYIIYHQLSKSLYS